MDNYIPDLDDLYTIVYTSGTTGNPKGAMITFKALANLKDPIYEMGIIDKQEHNVLFSYLPLGHITERIVVEFCSIIRKTTVCFSESLATFAKNLQETSPTSFMCVPRLWTQFQKNILAQIPQEKLDVMLAHPTEGEVVKKQLKAALGLSRADPIMSGSAPLSPALINWYKKIGINILEGYGRTEDCAFCAFNTPGHEIVGTIGRPNPGVEVKIDDNGELLTRSKMMMVGYYKDPETTKTVFTEDGFLRTGDKARFDENHNLIIMGRVNDSFKTDKGEFVNPIPIEHKFSHNNLLEQICLIGLNLPQPVLLAVLSEPAMKMDRDEIERSLKETFDAINPDLTKYEKIVHIFLVKEGWTPENALLTPTLKMKRNAIHDKYIDLALKNIDTPEVIIWE
jgi:long-chain acyl-CoA synthetase